MKKHLGFALTLLGVVCLAGPASAFQQLDVQGDYTQAASGMVFPVRVGPFTRSMVTQYDAQGRDISANYIFRPGKGQDVTITVYVYPAATPADYGLDDNKKNRGKVCVESYKRVVQEIGSFYAELEWEDAPKEIGFSPHEDVETYTGLYASMNVSDPRPGALPGKINRTEAYLFCHVAQKWFVKYRATYARDYNARALVDDFINGLPWTIRGM